MRVALLFVSAAACSFHATYEGTHYQCGAGGTCPSGQICVQNVCIEGTDVDGSLGGDAPTAPDAGTSDAAPLRAPCGALTALRDDFSTDRAGTIWDTWSDTGVTAAVTGGHLSISIPTNTTDKGGGYGSYYYYDFTNTEARVTVGSVA